MFIKLIILIFRYLILLSLITLFQVTAQEPMESQLLVAFYNTENLFLPQTLGNQENAPGIFDRPGWDEQKYLQKIENLARVIRALGRSYHAPAPDIIGLAETQNQVVLRDLINHPYLSDADYGIIHHDSPDLREIDVAMLYRKSQFIPADTQARRLLLINDEGKRVYTRDVLVVSGYFRQTLIHILINHWPSRRGGKEGSEQFRLEAARLNTRIKDSLGWRYSQPFIISMGDFNDDPTDPSVYHILGGRALSDSTGKLINPMLSLYQQGYGSLAYRDRWHLFDQILISDQKIIQNNTEFIFTRAGIFMPSWLKTAMGAYKGYPLRTYTGNRYTAGYSDHFPVYLLFREQKKIPESGKPDIVRDPG